MKRLVWSFALGLGCATGQSSPPSVLRAESLLREHQADKAGNLRLGCQPADAEVTFDDLPQGTCGTLALRRDLVIGKGLTKIVIRKAGFHTHEAFVEPGGTQTSLVVELKENK